LLRLFSRPFDAVRDFARGVRSSSDGGTELRFR